MIKITYLLIILGFLCSCSYLNNHNNEQAVPVDKTKFSFATTYTNGSKSSLRESITDDNNKIYTLNQNDVLNLLGNPLVIKNTQVNIIWQYRRSQCTINIVWQKPTDAPPGDTIEVAGGTTTPLNTAYNPQALDPSGTTINDSAVPSSNFTQFKIVYLEAVDLHKNNVNAVNCFLTIM